MTLNEAYEKRRQECLSLERQVKKLNTQLAAATKGLFTPSDKTDLLKQVVSYKGQQQNHNDDIYCRPDMFDFCNSRCKSTIKIHYKTIRKLHKSNFKF